MMATATVMSFVAVCFLLVTFSQEVWSYYCEWDLCGSDQYCCGDNLCCEYVYSLWYFWVGILFVVILLSACGGLFRYCYYNNGNHGDVNSIRRSSNYSPVPDDMDALVISDGEFSSRRNYTSSSKTRPGYFLPREPPPPYSLVADGPSMLVTATGGTSSKETNDFGILLYP